ncbi:uncharacterized protein EV420DRAFT_25662 [Desarmillaria tabescens]|uniref:Glycosyltransferase 61 catalytic domain-containing protein n=1 Tax=Armillaria tabescens TaxID=1929756 RepID=A0AA39U8C2_ARMTA|nr:uncharacterized protein EV420DRAFT_25662 [Desarmillaria tabescens]KAK0469350.1 hypothetical protein EV420DRAFT_25662 [Desarmillaria tabescens]
MHCPFCLLFSSRYHGTTIPIVTFVSINVILLSGTIYLNFHNIIGRYLAPQYQVQPLRAISQSARLSEVKPYTYADFLPLSTSEDHSLVRSTAWVPLSLSECTFGMPGHYAPCVAQRLEQKVLYAEELLYPSFEIRQPYFASEAHKERWKGAAMRIIERGVLQNDGWLVYKGQSGHNFVFENVSYRHSDVYDRWSADSCMSSLVSSDGLKIFDPLELLGRSKPPTIYRNAMIASSPNLSSFQHHLDRITHIVTQGAHLTLGSDLPYVITGRQGNQFVQQLWERLGFDDEHVLHSVNTDVYAENMIFSCRAVSVHPFLSLRTLEAFAIDSMKESSTRNKIMYIIRFNIHAKNGGRRVLNEYALLDAIHALLAERGKGEELIVFDETQYGSLSEIFDYFNENVMAVVGPHGGAMYHHRWAARGTLVIEMMPTTFTSMEIYEEAPVLSQTYAALVVEPSSPGGRDMIINPEDVTKLLREHLGIPMKRPRHAKHMGYLVVEETDQPDDDHLAEDPLRASYQWREKELGF